MGNDCSGGGGDIYDKPEVRPYRAEFDALQFKRKDVRKLYDLFKRVDRDDSGSIGLTELLTHMDVDKTNFTERVFSIFDEDGSGEVDFHEFVLALWNYCTLGTTTLDIFAFDMYDKDCSGYLAQTEIEQMVKDIYGKHAKSNHNAKSVVAQLKLLNKDLEISAEQFCIFCKNHQALLFPAFEMQMLLQNSTLGANFWARCSRRRVEVSKGKFVPVAQFIEMHASRNLNTAHRASSAPRNEDAMILASITGTKHDRQVYRFFSTEVPIVQSDITERLYATGHYEEALARANMHPNVKSRHDNTLEKLAVQTPEEASVERAAVLKKMKHNKADPKSPKESPTESPRSYDRAVVVAHANYADNDKIVAVGDMIQKENQAMKQAYPLDKVVRKPQPSNKPDPHGGITPLRGSRDSHDELDEHVTRPPLHEHAKKKMGDHHSVHVSHHSHHHEEKEKSSPHKHKEASHHSGHSSSEHKVHHHGARDEYSDLQRHKHHGGHHSEDPSRCSTPNSGRRAAAH